MHRHHVPPGCLEKRSLVLDKGGSRHFAGVLRLKEGDEVELFDGMGASATFRISPGSRPSALVLERTGEPRRVPPPKCNLVLAIAVTKGGRMDWSVEKAVELGTTEILPVLSSRSVVRFRSDAEAAEKRARWERIAIDAARQSHAMYLPKVHLPVSFDEAVARLGDCSQIITGALVPDAAPLREVLSAMRAMPPPGSVAWVVGPEGDFTWEEYGKLRAAGSRMASLGSLVLRAETAAIYGLCVLNAEFL